MPHDVQLKDASGAEIFKTDTFPGAAKRDYQVPALAAGTLHVRLHGARRT
ncbi:MAG: hypothetical protein WKF78_10900 [Candidatus Limnocylindrales bacterium]